jgi:hypothetical protein
MSVVTKCSSMPISFVIPVSLSFLCLIFACEWNRENLVFASAWLGLPPWLAKNLDTAEHDFVQTYGLQPLEAADFRRRIERDGCASVPVAV